MDENHSKNSKVKFRVRKGHKYISPNAVSTLSIFLSIGESVKDKVGWDSKLIYLIPNSALFFTSLQREKSESSVIFFRAVNN